MRGILALGAVVLAMTACAPAQVQRLATAPVIAQVTPPAMKVFASGPAPRTRHSNTVLARDFLDLTFRLESGQPLPLMTRFEGPISVQLTGNIPASLPVDLRSLLARLRNEAGINIRQTAKSQANKNATITIAAVTRKDIRRALPQAACFVAPNVTTLKQYRSSRRAVQTNWTLLRDRRQITIFLPNDASPQEVRDCLHEEVAQALGPLNDLYRLPSSVFNDDNVHTVLTHFDMLILRAYYHPSLKNGMNRAQVAAALPAIFNVINPSGHGIGTPSLSQTPQAFNRAIEAALGRNADASQRENGARTAISIANAQGWQDHRRAFAHYAYGRVLTPTNPAAAFAQYQLADRVYAQNPGTALHRAHVAPRLAGFALQNGDPATALRLTDAYIPIAKRHENAALLAVLLRLKSEALGTMGRDTEARSVRLDSMGWARYGFGSGWAARASMRQVALKSAR